MTLSLTNVILLGTLSHIGWDRCLSWYTRDIRLFGDNEWSYKLGLILLGRPDGLDPHAFGANYFSNRNNRLPCIRDSQGLTPLLIAASLGRRNMVSYLLSVTPFEQSTPIERIQLLLATISTDMYGMPCISLIISLRQFIFNGMWNVYIYIYMYKFDKIDHSMLWHNFDNE